MNYSEINFVSKITKVWVLYSWVSLPLCTVIRLWLLRTTSFGMWLALMPALNYSSSVLRTHTKTFQEQCKKFTLNFCSTQCTEHVPTHCHKWIACVTYNRLGSWIWCLCRRCLWYLLLQFTMWPLTKSQLQFRSSSHSLYIEVSLFLTVNGLRSTIALSLLGLQPTSSSGTNSLDL
jgi:hypothetical protein